MPVYEYRCTKCEKEFEYQQRMSDPPMTVCEACGGELERLISRTAFQLKGSGWYKDLYSSSKPAESTPAEGAAKTEGAKTEAAKPEGAKPESKSDKPSGGSGSDTGSGTGSGTGTGTGTGGGGTAASAPA
jgi:putative FmdB family regulatory protein